MKRQGSCVNVKKQKVKIISNYYDFILKIYMIQFWYIYLFYLYEQNWKKRLIALTIILYIKPIKFNFLTNMPLQDYQLISKMGTGKYSSVFKAVRLSDNHSFAIKKVPLLEMEPRNKRNALTEVKLLQNLKHPHIISLIEVCYDQFMGHLCLVLENAEKGDLSCQIRRHMNNKEPFKQEFLWSILLQISNGLQYLHQHNILHRDLKPSNILLFNSGIVKISDLNVSTSLENLNYTRTGTLSYASPEIWKGEVYDSKCDIWSLGCLMYEMAALKMPFEGQNMEALSKTILKCNYCKLSQSYSKQFRDLISFMIQINPRLRPSAKTIHKLCLVRVNPRKQQSKINSLTPNLERKESHYYLKPIVRQDKDQISLSKIVIGKPKTKRLNMDYNNLRRTYGRKRCQILPRQIESQLRDTSQVKRYIYNKLMTQNEQLYSANDQLQNAQQRQKASQPSIKQKRPQKIVQFTRARRNTEM